MSSSLSPDPWQARPIWPSLEATCRRWLTDEGSLTARIRARCERFSVKVLRQQLLRPYADERAVMGMTSREWAWVREVLLVADGVPVVFAHSVLAQRHARGPWQMFSRIGERSLGATLFADPRIARRPLRYRRLDERQPLYRAALRAAGIPASSAPTLWARRSRFERSGQALLVTEVFLPRIFSS